MDTSQEKDTIMAIEEKRCSSDKTLSKAMEIQKAGVLQQCEDPRVERMIVKMVIGCGIMLRNHYFRQMGSCLLFSNFVACELCDRGNPLLGARQINPVDLNFTRSLSISNNRLDLIVKGSKRFFTSHDSTEFHFL